MEDDDDDGDSDDTVRSSQRLTPTSSNSTKRARTNGIDRGTPSDSAEPEDENFSAEAARLQRRTVNRDTRHRSFSDGDDGNNTGESKFQPGAIVRVKLTNFVTYAKAEFFPGPNLNMIIGPNGTGKSSLVCAICLGLGWSPNVLGRASQISEFVKHGLDAAYVEIELQSRDNEPENHVVRLKIIRDGNGREWVLNGKKTSFKAIQQLTKSLSIQIDNLCQFLPQDKVSEFAALSPVELLLQTQRAAAPEQMLEWHEELKKYRRDQKQIEEQIERDKEALKSNESRQENLEAEVQRLRERQQIQEKVTLLKKTIPVVEYNLARIEHKQFKKELRRAKARLEELEEEVEPTMRSITHKHEYADQIKKVIGERKKAVQDADSVAEKLLTDIGKLDENITRIGQEGDAERKNEGQRKRDLHALQKKLEDMETKLVSQPVDFDGPAWNEKIRAKDHETRDISNEIEELKSQDAEAMRHGRVLKAEIDAGEQELAALDSQSGRQNSRIAALSSETAKAWKWVQENQGEFEREVFGPPLVTCSIKDPRYASAVESLMRKNDVLTITAQTQNDFKKLSDELLSKQALGDVTLRSAFDPLAVTIKHTIPIEDLQQIGLDGFALDYVDGPEPVLAMLCGASKLDVTAVSLNEINDDQYKMLVNSSCRQWVAGRYSYTINRRAEYGPQATSTATKTIKDAQFFIDRPVDMSARRGIEAKIQSLTQNFNEIKERIKPAREKRDQLIAKLKEVMKDAAKLRDQKSREQIKYGEYQTLPQNIERQKESIRKKEAEGIEIQGRMKHLRNQHDHAVFRKAEKALIHKEQVAHIRRCHEELLDAEIRLIEANSDVEALVERNRDTTARVEEEKNNVIQAEQNVEGSRAKAERLTPIVRDIYAEAEATGNGHYFRELPKDMAVEALEMEIAAEESKLEFIHASNPNAIRDFEKRQLDIDKLKAKVDEANEKLKRVSLHITKVRDKWEPELDKLIAEISEAFSYNFEQIGCAGEVGVHKDEDFEQWSIQIKVKFRENETLQILDQHRQSGGERSVSTIFYLMSLQSLARAPFRVVDEINQGMDPRNERMVHERMVEIACKEHTSQYFLITPKLLTNLRYDKRMKVHCIASGEYMPEDHRKMDIQKILAMRRAIVATG